MKKLWITLAILFGVIVVLALTCPSKEAHLEKITNIATEAVNSAVQEKSENDFLTIFTDSVTPFFLSGIVKELVVVEDHFIFSIGMLKYDDESKVVSIGFFNRVFAPGAQKAIEEALKEIQY